MSEVEAKKYLTTIPAEYVTESELNAKGYLTAHQDLSKYALKSEIPSKYEMVVVDALTTEVELSSSNFYTISPRTTDLNLTLAATEENSFNEYKGQIFVNKNNFNINFPKNIR
jgi:hypothetical protein